MTLNGVTAVILHYFTEFGAALGQLHHIKLVGVRPIVSATKCRLVQKESRFWAIYDLWRYSQRFVRTNALKRCTPVKSDILLILRDNWKTVRDNNINNNNSNLLYYNNAQPCKQDVILFTNKKSHFWAFDWYHTNGVMTIDALSLYGS